MSRLMPALLFMMTQCFRLMVSAYSAHPLSLPISPGGLLSPVRCDPATWFLTPPARTEAKVLSQELGTVGANQLPLVFGGDAKA